jgi:hypothetical protein
MAKKDNDELGLATDLVIKLKELALNWDCTDPTKCLFILNKSVNEYLDENKKLKKEVKKAVKKDERLQKREDLKKEYNNGND